MKQSFASAPSLVKRHTPAEILLECDPDGETAALLHVWADAVRAGELDLKAFGLSPALVWAKIVEGQLPPRPAEEPAGEVADMARWLEEQERAAGEEEEPAPAGGLDLDLVLAWQTIQQYLKVHLINGTYQQHFGYAEPTGRDGEVLVVAVPAASLAWIQGRLMPVVERAAVQADVQVRFVAKGDDSGKE